MIDRSILDHHIVGTSNDRLRMWLWIISSARWKEHKIFVRGQEIILKRGQLYAPIRTISGENRVSKGVAERFMRDLKTGTMIETVNGTVGNIITVCNYEKYQNFDEYSRTVSGTVNETAAGQRQDGGGTEAGHKRSPDESPDESPQPTPESGVGSNSKNEDKPSPKNTELAVTKNNAVKPKQKRGVSIPEGWVPSGKNIEDARIQDLTDREIDHEADRFRDYHLARGTVFKSWDAAWRTWVSNAKKWGKQNRRSGNQQAADLDRESFLSQNDEATRIAISRVKSRS